MSLKLIALWPFFLVSLLTSIPANAQTGIAALSGIIMDPSGWVLEQSTLTYQVSHPLHQVDGVSHTARGKGVCHAGQCDFLIAVPVKSFDSGDSNRDLHMLQVARGGQFPMVTMRNQLPEDAPKSTTVSRGS